MLDVQLRGIALLLASPVPWEYYINLSDVPQGFCGGGSGPVHCVQGGMSQYTCAQKLSARKYS